MTKLKPLRMLITACIAIVMLFAVVTFAGCNNDTLTLRDEVNAVGTQVYYFQNGGEATIADLDALLAQIDELKARINELNAENAELLAEMVKLRQEVYNMVDTIEAERLNADFVLNITAQSATLQFGQSITVTATFKNNTDEQVELSHSSGWIMPSIAYWYPPSDSRLTVIEPDEIITIEWQLGSRLQRGRHNLIAEATFHTIQRTNGNVVSSQSFTVESNKIVLTVV